MPSSLPLRLALAVTVPAVLITAVLYPASQVRPAALQRLDLGRLATDGGPGWPILIMLYALAVGFGVFWAISSHRLRQLKEQAEQHAREVRDLYENAPCGYHSLDAEGHIVRMNRTELAWLGYRAEELIGRRRFAELVTPATRPAFLEAFRGVLGPAREGACECELVTRSGILVPVAVQASAYVTAEGFQYSRATVFDLSERKKLERELARLAMTDPLTGLGNRRYLEEQAAMEMARARRSGAPLGLLLIDLDRFKRINDEHGHAAGDQVLKAFADQARRVLRDGDVLSRMGGEEFAVLLPDTGPAQAMVVAERLRASLERTPVTLPAANGTTRLPYTASLGVTRVDPDDTTLEPALRRADAGLYAAKAQGRNRVICRGTSATSPDTPHPTTDSTARDR